MLTLLRHGLVVVAVAGAALLAACGGAAPQVKVLGVSESRARPSDTPSQLVLFLEVINPTDRELQLRKLDYRLSAVSWFEIGGSVALTRAVGADSTAIVEVPVRLGEPGPGGDARTEFLLDGRLHASDSSLERSFPIEVSGTLENVGSQTAYGSTRLRLRIASGE